MPSQIKSLTSQHLVPRYLTSHEPIDNRQWAHILVRSHALPFPSPFRSTSAGAHARRSRTHYHSPDTPTHTGQVTGQVHTSAPRGTSAPPIQSLYPQRAPPPRTHSKTPHPSRLAHIISVGPCAVAMTAHTHTMNGAIRESAPPLRPCRPRLSPRRAASRLSPRRAA